MEKATVCITFDDGRKDNIKAVYDVLIPMRIASTLNITTGYVDGSCPDEMKPSSKPALTVEDVVELNRQPLVEIALHGDRHLNTEEDVEEGRRKIIDWLKLPADAELGFASPNCKFSVDSIGKDADDYFSRELLYVRGGLNIRTHEMTRDFFRKAGRVVNAPLFFKIAYAETLMNFSGQKGLYSVPVLKTTSAEQVCALIDECIQRKKLLILQFHSIVEDTENEDNWSWSMFKFEKMCRHIEKKCNEGVLRSTTVRKLFE